MKRSIPLPRRGRRSRWAAVALLAGLLACTGAVAAASTDRQGPDLAAYATPTPADVQAGRQLFVANCSTCHGMNAQGSGTAPSLYGVGAASAHFQLSTGRMPLRASGPQAPRGPVSYTEEQIRQMTAYVGSLGPGPQVPSAQQLDYSGLSDEQIAIGGQIFRTNCAMCHSAAGSGGALTQGKYAPNLRGVDAVSMYEAMVTGPQSMPVFSDSTLTPENKVAVIAYLKTMEDNPNPGLTLGQLGPVSEGAFLWGVGLSALIGIAVWLGAKAR